ncbi:MCE family protein [Betaproteobacteria bacterium PRO7]|nr:MCE family protein [Betaproteobacteria bacterium PRO7]
MEAEARYTYVGAGVIALIAALVGAVVWLKRVGSEQDLQRYTVYFERQRLDGLQIGGDVDMRGIKIGRVDSYALADDRVAGDEVNRVRVTIRVDRRAPVRTNTVAVVTRNFVTGIAQITLVTPEPAGPPLESAPPGEPHPVIAEGRSDLDEIAGRVGQLGDMAAEVMTNLNRVMAPENRQAFAQTLKNLRELTAGLNQRLDRFDRTLDSVGRAADQVGRSGDRIAGATEHAGQRLDALIADAQRSLAQIDAAAVAIGRTAESLQTQTQTVAQRVDRSTAALEDQLAASLAELRVSVDAAARALDRLQDPRRALLGPDKGTLGPGESLR